MLWASLGFKNALKVCLNYPALVLTPCFGSWTFGSTVQIKTSNCCMSSAYKNSQITVSYFHTWVNYGISLIGAIVTLSLAFALDRDLLGGFFTDCFAISCFLIIAVLPICIGFVQTVDICCNFLCRCCPSKCFPAVQHSVLDVDDMD